MPTADDLLQGLLGVGDVIRYGTTPTEKYKQLIASPAYQQAPDEASRTEAERLQSAGMSARHLSRFGPAGMIAGVAAPMAANLIREGTQGVGAVMRGRPFFTPGGFNAADQTPGDEDPAGGFNLRSLKTAGQGTVAGLLAGLLGR